MIHFRFFLVSVVAVFLALAVGISMGSGFLGEVVLGAIREQIAGVQRTNQNLQEQVTDLRRDVRNGEAFTEAARRSLIDDVLVSERVVVVTFDGTDDVVLDAVRAAVEDADGEIVSTLRLTEKVALEDDADRIELAELLGSSEASGGEMREELAGVLGSALAGASRLSGREGQTARSTQRLDGLLDALQDARFVTVEGPDGDAVVPTAARFLVVGGGPDDAPFDVGGFALGLLPPLDRGGAVSLVAEPSDSAWNLVPAVREDADAAQVAATVDDAGSLAGEVAIALGLDRAIQGSIGHYGFADGATEPIPPPTPED